VNTTPGRLSSKLLRTLELPSDILRKACACLILVTAGATAVRAESSHRITIDGDFSDWVAVPSPHFRIPCSALRTQKEMGMELWFFPGQQRRSASDSSGRRAS
jgi:hypothetical protein